MKKRIREYIMDTTLFWRLYFCWEIRKARKRRIAREEKQKSMPQLDTEQYWEMVHSKKAMKE